MRDLPLVVTLALLVIAGVCAVTTGIVMAARGVSPDIPWSALVLGMMPLVYLAGTMPWVKRPGR